VGNTLWELVPAQVRSDLRDVRARAAGFGAGPSLVARKTHAFRKPVPAQLAFGWLERYRDVYKRAHVRMGNGAVLWMLRDSFEGVESDESLRESDTPAPVRPNMEVSLEMLRVPFARAYWVDDGRLLAGCYPGSADPREARAKLTALADFGVTAVANLMETTEVGHNDKPFVPYEDDLRALGSARGFDIECKRFPVRDTRAPTATLMVEMLDWIDAAAARGGTVYVHCWGGRGRTGTVVGCYLARHGIATGQAALDRIVALRARVTDADLPSPEPGSQVRMVRGWAQGK
jgi:hypothetical protein